MPSRQKPNAKRASRLRAADSGAVGSFDGCRVTAWLGGLSFTNDAQIRVTFVIPAESVEAALPLRHVAPGANPMPLTLDVRVHEPFSERAQADDVRLRAMSDG